MPTKTTAEKLNTIDSAWATLRPQKSFAGLTLALFREKTNASLAARAAVANLENQLIAANDRVDTADKVTNEILARVVAGVKADEAEGEDSELYEAMGYVRKSERATGLKRPRKAVAEAATASK
jgi:hypothetical protein